MDLFFSEFSSSLFIGMNVKINEIRKYTIGIKIIAIIHFTIFLTTFILCWVTVLYMACGTLSAKPISQDIFYFMINLREIHSDAMSYI